MTGVSREWRIRLAQQHTTAIFAPASSDPRLLFVLAHGAGGHRDDPGMISLSAEFHRRGIDVVRFNFPYREKKSGPPDHGFHVTRRSGRTDSEVIAEIGDLCLDLGVAYAHSRLIRARAAAGARSFAPLMKKT